MSDFKLEGFEDTKYVPKKLSEQEMKCPVCGALTKLYVYAHEVPIVGTILLFVLICPNCGYRYRDLAPVTYAGKHVRITIRVNKPDALNTIFYKSPYAYIMIPELHIEVTPGPANPGEITTPEALLLRIAETLFPLCDTTENPVRCYDSVQQLVRAANGECNITIVLDDPSGLSAILKADDSSIYELSHIEASNSEGDQQAAHQK